MSELQRKYLPTFSELIDKLTIAQLKEVNTKEFKKEYAREISEILYDLDVIISSKGIDFDANTIRAIIVLAQTNFSIMSNEINVKKGKRGIGKALKLMHGLNSVKNVAKNRIQENIFYGGRKEYEELKNEEVFKDWEVSWDRYKKPKTLINQQMEVIKAKIQKELSELPTDENKI